MAIDYANLFVPVLLAFVLGAHGQRKKSLTTWGGITAFLVGSGIMSGAVRVFGVGMIVFYVLGTLTTKYGKKRKATLEEGYQSAGYRTGWQVLSNSVGAVAAATLWNVLFAPKSLHGMAADFMFGADNVGRNGEIYGAWNWCPADRDVGFGMSRALVFAALGHFACCLGDTLASELGILASSAPVLVTSGKRVPPGTNGAISVGGTLASIFGGAIVGAAMGGSLILENYRCREIAREMTISFVTTGALAGGFGSMVDSVLGATIQITRYSLEKKVVLQDGSRSEGDVKVISGYGILTNNQVNLVSSLVTAGVVGWMTTM